MTKEERLLERLGFPRIAELSHIDMIELAVKDAFCENKSGRDIDSLRRIYVAVRGCNPYRGTPEYDDLILEVEPESYTWSR